MPESVRREQCACGGLIAVVVPAYPDDIMRAVRIHHGTTRHQLWRDAGGLEPRPRPAGDPAYEGRLVA